jgi:hypothetical protein
MANFFAQLNPTNILFSAGWNPDVSGFIADDGTNSHIIFPEYSHWAWQSASDSIIYGWQYTPLPDFVISNNFEGSDFWGKIFVTSINSGMTWRQTWLIHFRLADQNKQ